jgi:hypothetical protein
MQVFEQDPHNFIRQHCIILRGGSLASVRRYLREKRSCYFVYQRAFSQRGRGAMVGETARKAPAVNGAGVPEVTSQTRGAFQKIFQEG